MRKLFFVTLITALMSVAALAQNGSMQNAGDIQNMGIAPHEINGIGRADVRVVDESGNPVQGARVLLESRRTDGFFCESWNWTNTRGVAVLPPIHMGNLRFVVEAPGYRRMRVEVPYSQLGQPVQITLVRR